MPTIAPPLPVESLPSAEERESPLVLLPHGRIPALDAMRGLAILMVTLYRFRAGPHDASPASQFLFPLLDHGACGVDLFFVLSGFLITGILYDAKHRRHYFRDFYMRRVLRIFPLYYGVLLLSLFVVPWLSHLPSLLAEADANQVWLWTYSANLLIGGRGEWCLGSFNHFWSLAVEEHFYLLWPLVIYRFSRPAAMRMALTLAVLSALGRVAWLLCGGNDAAAEVLTVFRLDGLLLGAWLALAARGPDGLRKLASWAKAAASLTGLTLLPVLFLNGRFLTLPMSIYAVFFGSLIVLAITAKPDSRFGRIWNWRVLHVLGKYSYAMYVFQLPLIPLLAVCFTADSLSETLGSALFGRLSYIALMFTATLLLAVASWHLYEKHFLRLKTRFSGN